MSSVARRQHAHSGCYKDGQGRVLFVPSSGMLRVHKASKACKSKMRPDRRHEKTPSGRHYARNGPSIRDLAEKAEWTAEDKAASPQGLGGHVNDKNIFDWLNRRFPDQSWLRGFLLEGEKPPSNVTVAKYSQICRGRIAFDYISHCEGAGLAPDKTYLRWLDVQIQDLGMLKWLFGGTPPAGTLVIDNKIQQLKKQSTDQAIATAAGLAVRTVYRWQRRPVLRAGLDDAMATAARPGNFDWRKTSINIHAQMKEYMWKYAKAATLRSRCKRAGLSMPEYFHLLKKVERLNLQRELERYINTTERGTARSSGMITPRFFVPTPGMLQFRKVAQAAMAEQKAWRLFEELPLVDQWFLDVVTPRIRLGQRRTIRFSDHEEGRPKSSEFTVPRNGDVLATGQPAVRSEGNQQTAVTVLTPIEPTRNSGRRVSPQSDDIQWHCYEGCTTEKTLASTRAGAKAKFGTAAPKNNGKIAEYAERYAKRQAKKGRPDILEHFLEWRAFRQGKGPRPTSSRPTRPL